MISRRDALRAAGTAAAASLLPARAFALDYPTRSVRWVVSSAAGGSADVVSRLVGSYLSDRLGQSFVMDNRPGAGVNIATDLVVKAPADGYTLLVVHKANVVAKMLYSHLDYDFDRDIEPVAGIARGPLFMLVNPQVPAKTLPEFIAYAKAHPGAVNMGSAGNGTDPHLAGELFNMLADVKMTHVPYRGGSLALTDLLGGHVQLMFSNLPVLDYIKSGALRALAVTTATRSPDLPDVPAVAEVVPGYETSVWFGVGMRTGCPAGIAEKLNGDVGQALLDPKVKAGLAVLTAAPMPLSRAEFKKMIADETTKWAKVIQTANIKPD